MADAEAAASGDLDADVRRTDEARWLASRFAPESVRSRLIALYAFNHEVARVRETVSDPLVGEIRLAWWREAIGEIYDAPERARRHPIVLALAEALADPAMRPPLEMFEALIHARARDLDARRFADMAELEAYSASTAGGLVRIAARMAAAEPISADVDAGLSAAGRAWGLAGLARALPAHAAQGWITPPDPLSALELERMLSGGDAAALCDVIAPLVEHARAAFAEARAKLAGAPPALWPAFGYVSLLPSLLRSLEALGPLAQWQRRHGFLDRTRLVLAAARGAI